MTGTGYAGDGAVEGAPGHPILDEEWVLLVRLGTAAILANEGDLERVDDRWRYHGDSIDVVFLASGYKLGLDPAEIRASFRLLRQIPYESERRVVVQGALETLLSHCTAMATPDGGRPPQPPLDRAGLRIGLVRRVPRARRGRGSDHGGVSGGPAPAHAPQACRIHRPRQARRGECRTAGIRVVMVTGDHLSTALSINDTLGIASKGEDVATGADLDKLGSIEVPEYHDGVGSATVFARVALSRSSRSLRPSCTPGTNLLAPLAGGVFAALFFLQ